MLLQDYKLCQNRNKKPKLFTISGAEMFKSREKKQKNKKK